MVGCSASNAYASICGTAAAPAAPCLQALRHFRRAGKRLLFLTNNSSKSRVQYLAKFKALGIEATFEEVVPTSYAAAAYLQSIGFDKSVFLVGNEGVAQELEAAGISYRTWDDVCSSGSSGGGNGSSGNGGNCAAALREQWTAEAFAGLPLDPSIGAVVVGWDPGFSYSKLCYASVCLRELPDGCLFVATNLDSADKSGEQAGGRGGWWGGSSGWARWLVGWVEWVGRGAGC